MVQQCLQYIHRKLSGVLRMGLWHTDSFTSHLTSHLTSHTLASYAIDFHTLASHT